MFSQGNHPTFCPRPDISAPSHTEVGGSSASRAPSLPSGVDFEEALGDDVPMELWTRQLRGRGGPSDNHPSSCLAYSL